MTEYTRTCKRCGESFTTNTGRRLYCLTCSPPGGRASHRKTMFTPEQHKWIEKRNRRNMAQFFFDEITKVQDGGSIPETAAKILRKNGLVTRSRKGGPLTLTGLCRELLREAV